MAHLAPFVIPSSAVFGVLLALGSWRIAVGRRRRAAEAAADDPTPSSLVRVLRSDQELVDAVERAARFERRVADTVRARARRYETMVPRPLVAVPPALEVPLPTGLPDDAPRSA